MLLVDWELAGRGPAAFDVGTVLAEYLCRWVESIPMYDPREPRRFLDRAGHPVRSMQPALQAFWTAYRLGGSQAPALADVVELTAVRLVQAAVERALVASQLSAHVITLVQVADNLLRDPESAAFQLLGLDE